jgi:hypothetical protein
MAVSLSALRTSRTLLPRNIIICYFFKIRKVGKSVVFGVTMCISFRRKAASYPMGTSGFFPEGKEAGA